MKRILIDGRFIGVGESMTRYCLEIVKGVLELDHENEYTLLIRPQGEKLTADSLQLTAKNLRTEILDIPHYSLAEQTKLLKYLNEKKFDLVHFIQFNHPVYYRGKYVVTIHDLTLIGHLHRQQLHKRFAFGQVMKSAVKDSAQIITISETSKQEIIDYYHVPEQKITVTYLAADDKYTPELKKQTQKIDDFKNQFKISGEYFLYAGMWKKHKNLIRMLEAYGKFKSEQSGTIPQLVLVGKIDRSEPAVLAMIDKINHGSTSVITTGFVDDDELAVSYAGALAYIIPSLSEGFGLPPLESMACGTPVISSNLSAMPEILGEAPLYFDPYDVADIADKMRLVASDEHLRATLMTNGLEQVKKYNWQKTAKGTMDVYRSCLK